MGFNSGRVTFCRFAVAGDAPRIVDEALLSVLHEYRFQETQIGAPDEVEVGFVTPEHLLDTRFSFEKIGYGGSGGGGPSGGRVLLGMRMDTHKVPAEVRRAYRMMNEQSSAADNPSGFASKGQKREAMELADRQVRDDLAKGLYRRSKVVPLLWDLGSRTLFCGATGSTVAEELVRLFRRAFALELTLQSAGVAAGSLLKSTGHSRDYEDLHPSPFTPPPVNLRHAHEADDDEPLDPSTPRVPWVAKALDLKDFLGNEFLLWLWWKTETDEAPLITPAGECHLAFDKALDLDCAWGLGGKIGVRGDGPTRLKESAEALRTGKWPRKAGLLLSDGASQWELTLAGDAWTVGSAKLPEVPDAQNPRELTEARLDLTCQLAALLDALYATFLNRRTSAAWPADRDGIRQWVRQRRPSSHTRPAETPAPRPTPQPVITLSKPPAPVASANA